MEGGQYEPKILHFRSSSGPKTPTSLRGLRMNQSVSQDQELETNKD